MLEKAQAQIDHLTESVDEIRTSLEVLREDGRQYREIVKNTFAEIHTCIDNLRLDLKKSVSDITAHIDAR